MTLPSAPVAAIFVAATGVGLGASGVLVRRREGIAARLGLAEAVLGLIPALADNSPEIASAITALARGQHDIGIGVVLGVAALADAADPKDEITARVLGHTFGTTLVRGRHRPGPGRRANGPCPARDDKGLHRPTAEDRAKALELLPADRRQRPVAAFTQISAGRVPHRPDHDPTLPIAQRRVLEQLESHSAPGRELRLAADPVSLVLELQLRAKHRRAATAIVQEPGRRTQAGPGA